MSLDSLAEVMPSREAALAEQEAMEVAFQRAEKGLAWLKESGPIFGLDVEDIDLDMLQLNACERCVLGQLGGDYSIVIRKILGSHITAYEQGQWAQEHGFLAGDLTNPATIAAGYRRLDLAWRQLIEADRAAV
jgi:hypothetical protein